VGVTFACAGAAVSAVLVPLVDGVTAEIVDGVYPGRAAALLEKAVNQQVGRVPAVITLLVTSHVRVSRWCQVACVHPKPQSQMPTYG
jgi:hypothetical protein